MSPFGTIVLTAAVMAMLSAQVTMQTINQTKKPRCAVSIRPIPQPEREQPSSRSISRSLSSPSKSPSALDLKPSSSPSGSKSSLAGPRSPVSVSPKTPFSSRSKSQSNRPVPIMSSASPKSPFSSRSKSRSNGPLPLSSSGPRSTPDSVRSKPSRKKSPNSVQGSSNLSSPDSRTVPPSDFFSLFKLPLQLISNIFMPPTIKQNTSSVVSPLINFQMPLTFSTIHATPYQVPCTKITNSPTLYGNPEHRTYTEISAGPCSNPPPPTGPCSNPPPTTGPCSNPPPPTGPCSNPPSPTGPCSNPPPTTGPCSNPPTPAVPCSNPPPPPTVPCNNPTTTGNTDHLTPISVPDAQSSNGFLIYNFLCNLLFRKTISIFPPAVTTPPTVDRTKNETTVTCIPTTVSDSTIETVTITETPTEASTETITTTPSSSTIMPTTPSDNTKPTVTPAGDHNGTSCHPDIAITSTQTPPVDVDVICKVISCTPILRLIITKRLVCKSSLLSTCYFNKPAKKQWHINHPVIHHYPNTFHDTRNGYATALSDDSTLDNKQAELILKLIQILLSSSNN